MRETRPTTGISVAHAACAGKPFRLDAAVHDREPLRFRESGGNRLPFHLFADTDHLLRDPRGRPFERPIGRACGPGLPRIERKPVIGVHDERHRRHPGRPPSEDASLARMRVHDVGALGFEQCPERAKGGEVLARRDWSDEIRDQSDLDSARSRIFDQRPFSAFRRASDQHHVEPILQRLARQDRVLLSATGDEARDHMVYASSVHAARRDRRVTIRPSRPCVPSGDRSRGTASA
jgi:hypothetical protein